MVSRLGSVRVVLINGRLVSARRAATASGMVPVSVMTMNQKKNKLRRLALVIIPTNVGTNSCDRALVNDGLRLESAARHGK